MSLTPQNACSAQKQATWSLSSVSKEQETGQAEPERFGEISAAMDISDEEERNNVFREGEALLIERNKNACRADK